MLLNDKPRKPPRIIQGSDRTLVIRLQDNACVPDPFDISSATQIKVGFLNADGTVQVYSLGASGGVSVISGPAGKLQVQVPASGTALLAPTNLDCDPPYQGVEVELTIGGAVSRVNIPNSIDVQPPLFSGML